MGVKVTRAMMIKCDPAIKEYLIHVDEERKISNVSFIVEELDDNNLLIKPEFLGTIQKQIDELMRENTFPVGDTGN